MTEPAPKRRLPIVSNSGGGSAGAGAGGGGGGADEEQDRPPWHWSVIGAAAIFLAWLPLTMLASYATAGLVARAGADVDPSAAAGADVPAHVPILIIAMPTLAFGIASFAGGFMVGRYGGKAGRKEATVAGFIAAAVAWALAASQPVAGPGPGALAWVIILVTIAGLGAGVAYAGGRFGLRRRPRGLG